MDLNSTGSKIILWGIILALIGFTISRTLDFLKRALPPDQQYVAYLALVAFDLGMLGWFYFGTNAAQGRQQRAVAYGMTFICMGGVIITTICDLFIVASQNGVALKPDAQMGTIALWVVSIVITLNIVAGVVVHLVDPKHQRHMATMKAKDVIFAASFAAIEQRAGEIAPRIASASANYWEAQVTQELIGSIPGAKVVESAPPQIAPAAMKQEAEIVAVIPPKEKLGEEPVMVKKKRRDANAATSKLES